MSSLYTAGLQAVMMMYSGLEIIHYINAFLGASPEGIEKSLAYLADKGPEWINDIGLMNGPQRTAVSRKELWQKWKEKELQKLEHMS